VLPPTDLRYLAVRATDVSRITGAQVAAAPERPSLVRVPAHVQGGAATVVVDLGYSNVPVDELRISASTPRYDRPFTVVAGRRTVAAGTLMRLGAARATVVPLSAQVRYLRIRIRNGDDPPLRGLRVEVLARPRPLLVEGGHPGLLTVYYGGRVRPPDYDFARLPASALGAARLGTLGPERLNPAFRAVEHRGFFKRHKAFITVVLAVAGVALLATAALALWKT
jgi:hypothetical protein